MTRPGAPRHRRTRAVSYPPMVRVEDSVLDRANSEGRAWPALALVLEAEQRRLTTSARLREALATRERHRWRALLQEALAEVDDGVPSPLELRYLRRVEQAHGLPRSGRVRPGAASPVFLDLDAPATPAGPHTGNTPAGPSRSSLRYRDIGYRRWRMLIALDSLVVLPDTDEFRRRAQGGASTRTPTELSAVPLRLGWQEIVSDPCAVAAEIGAALRARGWKGRPRTCCPPCRAEELFGDPPPSV